MKVFTKRNEFETAESCIIELDSIQEWTQLSMGIDKQIKANEEYIDVLSQPTEFNTESDIEKNKQRITEIQSNLDMLRTMSKSLHHKNEDILENFDLDRVKAKRYK